MAGAILTSAIKMKSLVTLYQVTWISDASGAVNGSVFNAKMGTIIAVEFIPGTSITQPTDLYDCDCLDADSISVFDNGAGATIGANLSNVVALHGVPMIGTPGVTMYRRWHRGGPLQLTVANAGNTTSGVVKIYMTDGIL